MRYDPPFHRGNGLLPVLIVLAGLVIYPLLFDSPYARHLLILVFVYAIVASGWDLSLGYGGLFNFAHVALFAIGIYTYGILAKILGVPPWLAIALAGVAAVLLAVALVLPVLRLDGVYVILVTLACSQLIRQIIISQSEITGGAIGMPTLPSLSLDGYRFTRDGRIGYYYTGLVLLILSTGFLYGITRSRLGRTIVALRDNKYYALSRGVSEARTRVLTLAVSALPTGIAGGFYGSYVRTASPDAFDFGFLTLFLSILLVGGTGTIWGPILAAFLITLSSEALADLDIWRNIIIAMLILVTMIFYPSGIWGIVQELRDWVETGRTSLKAWRNRWRGGQKAMRLKLLGASETFLATDHGMIAVADSGADLPAILLIHGNSACKEVFQHQFAQLRDRYRLVAFDLPGHGVSSNGDPEKSYNIPAYAEIAEEVLAWAGVVSPVILGWSLGGYVALELAARGRVRVRGLAITGTSPLNVAPDDFAAGYDASSHLVLAGKQYFSARERQKFATSAIAPYSPASTFLHDGVKRTDGRARSYMIAKLPVVDWPRQMRMLRAGEVPFAILNGSDDPFLNHRYVASLPYGGIWTGKPYDIADGRHAPFFNKPDAFNEGFVRFIEENCTGGPVHMR